MTKRISDYALHIKYRPTKKEVLQSRTKVSYGRIFFKERLFNIYRKERKERAAHYRYRYRYWYRLNVANRAGSSPLWAFKIRRQLL